jgi:hypothetical protein
MRKEDGMLTRWEAFKQGLAILADVITVVGIPILGFFVRPTEFVAVYNPIRFSAAVVLAFVVLWVLSYMAARVFFNATKFILTDLLDEKHLLTTASAVLATALAILLIGTVWGVILAVSRPISFG